MKQLDGTKFNGFTIKVGDRLWYCPGGKKTCGMEIVNIIEWGDRNVWILYGDLRCQKQKDIEFNDMRVCTAKRWMEHVRKRGMRYETCGK